MTEPNDDKMVEHISRGDHGGLKLTFEADTIKITESDDTKKAKKVSIRLSREEAKKICEALTAKQFEGCFSESSQPSDPLELFFEERQV